MAITLPIMINVAAQIPNVSEAITIDIMNSNPLPGETSLTQLSTELDAGVLAAATTVTIEKISAEITGTISGSNTILTAEIGGIAVTNGAVTIVTSGSQAGDRFSAVPTANNSLAVGDKLQVVCGGESTGNISASLILFIKVV